MKTTEFNLVKPEFRLYYDTDGKVITYTCEKPPGNYIVIDALTYAKSRPDVLVIDGTITPAKTKAVIARLVPDVTGKRCASEDISIIADKKYRGKTTLWELKTNEY